METGKLGPGKLKRLVLDQLASKHDDVLLSPSLGEDASVIDFGENVCVVSTDPITGALENMGRLAVHVACNDIAATGAVPLGIQVALLLPVGSGDQDIETIMADIEREARALNIQILGGHTEITSAVKQNVVVLTALGKAGRGEFIPSGGAQPGDKIILTKGVGLEGAGILASDYGQLLKEKGVSQKAIKKARKFFDQISVVPEGIIGARHKVTAMHDVTEGGVIGAIYEMVSAAKRGFIVWEEKIYIPEAVKEICLALQIDPLRIISSGAMLMTSPNPEAVIDALEDEGIKTSVIGEIREEGRKLIRKDNRQEDIKEFPRDELWRFIQEVGEGD